MSRHNKTNQNTICDFLAVLIALLMFFGLIWPSIETAFQQRENFLQARTNEILQQGDFK